jgi:hypothetical protein
MEMKKEILSVIGLSVISSAVAAPLFNVVQSPNSSAFTVSTTIAGHTYPAAGIRLNTPGYELVDVVGFLPAPQCVRQANGYCTFSVSNTMPKTFGYAGSGGTALNLTLCLNGKGPQSCQDFTLPANPHYLYVTNYSTSQVSACTLDVAGLITSCSDAGGDAVLAGSLPQGIALNASETMAYITQGFGGPFVYQCAINTNGSFNSCQKKTVSSPAGAGTTYGMIALNSLNTLAYIFDSTHVNVLACPLMAGAFGENCTNTGASGFSSSLSGITLDSDNSHAYLADYSLNTVTVCNVNGASFSNCIAKSGGSSFTFDGPGGVALNKTGNILYVTSYFSNTVYGCSTAPNNTTRFNSCFVASSSVNEAWDIALNASNSMAYVTNYGNTTYQCPVQADGTFGTCVVQTGFSDAVGVAVG